MKESEIIFGIRAVLETVYSDQEIEKIIIQTGLSNPLIKELITSAGKKGIPVSFIPRQKINSLSYKNHQGVICIRSAARYAVIEDLIDKSYYEARDPFFLLLDRITDVRNFGAVARTAECAGLDAIVITEKRSAPLTGDAVKSSAGALNYLPVCRTASLKKTAQQLKDNGIKVIACLEKAEKTLYELDMNVPLALIVGSEEDGISPALLEEADEQVKIPMYGAIKSLNVSVAAGIALYEVIRQKKYHKNTSNPAVKKME